MSYLRLIQFFSVIYNKNHHKIGQLKLFNLIKILIIVFIKFLKFNFMIMKIIKNTN